MRRLTDAPVDSILEISPTVILDPSFVPVPFQHDFAATVLQLPLQE